MTKHAITVLALGVTVMLPGAANPQTASPPDAAVSLVVLVEADLCGQSRMGAGILFGWRDQNLYVATAGHLVTRNGCDTPTVRTGIRLFPGEKRPSVLLDSADPNLDLRVLKVARDPGQASDPLSAAAWQRLADASLLSPGARLRAVGNGDGGPWATTPEPDGTYTRSDGDRLVFASDFDGPGFSGGALFTAEWRLVGMLTEGIDRWNRKAVDLQRILKRLREWNYPVALTTPSSVEITDFTAARSSIDLGTSTTLRWLVKNADHCTMAPGIGVVDAAGTRTVSPGDTTKYELGCEGNGGTAIKAVIVTIIRPVQIRLFEAQPATAVAGTPIKLAWRSENAERCTIVGVTEDKGPVGSVIVVPDGSDPVEDYVLKCSAGAGWANASLKVPVVSAPTVHPKQPVKISRFSGTPNPVTAGREVVLRWETKNATSCSIDEGVGTVATNGTKRVRPTETTTYSLTCNGDEGPVSEDEEVKVDATPRAGMFCCDGFGLRRCIMQIPGTMGGPCFCVGQGNGFVCP